MRLALALLLATSLTTPALATPAPQAPSCQDPRGDTVGDDVDLLGADVGVGRKAFAVAVRVARLDVSLMRFDVHVEADRPYDMSVEGSASGTVRASGARVVFDRARDTVVLTAAARVTRVRSMTVTTSRALGLAGDRMAC